MRSSSTDPRPRGATLAAALLLLLAPDIARAQKAYYNTDRGRPLQVEDAWVVERYGMELTLAPVRMERLDGGSYHWSVEPELAWGLLPRTQVEVGLALAHVDAAGTSRSGLAGVELSLMHTLNAETEGWPALGVRGDLLLPAGNLAPDRAIPSLAGMATRTAGWGRLHLNAQVTAGDAPVDAGDAELSRWLAGAAVDHTFPLSSTLVSAEVVARRPLGDGEPLAWSAGVGVRRQLGTTLAFDAGIGRRLTGDARSWSLTVGTSYGFALASLFPAGR